MNSETEHPLEELIAGNDLPEMYRIYSSYMRRFNSVADPPCRVLEMEEFCAEMQNLDLATRRALIRDFSRGYGNIEAKERIRLTHLLHGDH